MNERLTLLSRLATASDQRILQIVLDGVGGLPDDRGRTELSAAHTPNLDQLARASSLGQLDPVFPGITPGSGLAHLALFGYNPMEYEVGRGVLAAMGVGLEMPSGSVAARCNFITRDRAGVIRDRRAGRLPSEDARRLVALLQGEITQIDGVQIRFAHVMEYRFVVVFTGKGLYGEVGDTDPQVTGVKPLAARAMTPQAQPMADLADRFLGRVWEVLADQPRGNGIVMRGFGRRPELPTLRELYGLKAQVIASYPDYKGVAALAGMTVQPIPGEGELLAEKIAAYRKTAADFDYTFFHVKKTDSYGEDHNFDAKVTQIEAFDAALPQLLDLGTEVVAITGDHSTPATMGAHSWHPVPLLVRGPWQRNDVGTRFSEDETLRGSLGRLRSEELMAILLAQAGRLKKYGA